MVPFLYGVLHFWQSFSCPWSFARLGCIFSESCEDDMSQSSNMIVPDGSCNSSLELWFSFEFWPIITVIKTCYNRTDRCHQNMSDIEAGHEDIQRLKTLVLLWSWYRLLRDGIDENWFSSCTISYIKWLGLKLLLFESTNCSEWASNISMLPSGSRSLLCVSTAERSLQT